MRGPINGLSDGLKALGTFFGSVDFEHNGTASPRRHCHGFNNRSDRALRRQSSVGSQYVRFGVSAKAPGGLSTGWVNAAHQRNGRV